MDYTEIERLYIESVKLLKEFQDYRMEFFKVVFDLYTSKQTNLLKPGTVSTKFISKQLDDYYIYEQGFLRKKKELRVRYDDIMKKIEALKLDPDNGITKPTVDLIHANMAKILSLEDYINGINDQAKKLSQ